MSLRTAAAALALALAAVVPAAAEIRKLIAPCGQDGGAVKLCPLFKVGLRPAAGWREDDREGLARGIQLCLPQGRTFGNAPALIYAKVRPNTSGAALAEWSKVSNDKWIAANPGARIERLREIDGRAAVGKVLIERFTNPNLPNQPAELGATFAETDGDGNAFVVQLVLSGLDTAAVAAAEPAFTAMIDGYAGRP